MTWFTDSPFEKMMTQRPNGRRDNAPPVLTSPVCASCPYRGASPLCGLLFETATGEKRHHTETMKRAVETFVFMVQYFYHIVKEG